MRNPLIYRLLEIKPDSGKMIFFLFPPVYALWLYAIGKRLLQKQNKSNQSFTFFATGTFLFFTIAFFIAPLLRIFQINLFDNNFFNNSLPGLIVCSFWILSVGMTSYITVKYEQTIESDKYQSFIQSSISIAVRFFVLFFWFIGIWGIQREVNTYND